MRTRPVALLFVLAATAVAAPAAGASAPTDSGSYISFAVAPGSFPLVAGGKAAPIVVSASDHPGVVRVVGDLQADVERVTGVKPAVATDDVPAQPVQPDRLPRDGHRHRAVAAPGGAG
jgi:hypothetical protein